MWGDDFGFDGDFDKFFAGQVNGLAGAASGEGLYLNLARRSGGSPVRIELFEAEPPIGPEWEDVVEVSITVPVVPSRDGPHGQEKTVVVLRCPRGYRVRVNAFGRDAGRDGEFAEENVDSYLLQLWVATPRPDEVLRMTSADASYWHNEVGGRR